MAQKKTIKKRSLTVSVIVLCLSIAALIGGTFAWFTDTASTSVNRIQAGSLDVGLQYKNSTQADYTDVTKETNVFKTDTLWEPGHVEYAVLKISNEGTLALKYNLGVSVSSETAGKNVNGNEFKLSDYIQYAVIDGDQSDLTRDALVSAADSYKATLSTVYSSSGNILADGNEKVVTLVVWMPSTVGNEVNYATGTTQPTIDLGIDLYATQYTNESDSFNSTYDSAAPWTGGTDDDGLKANTVTSAKTVAIDSAEQLASFAKAVNAGNTYEGYTITLNKNLDLNNLPWTPIGTSANPFMGTFDGNGKTISNLTVSGGESVGFFGRTESPSVVKNLTINNANVTGKSQVAALIGEAYRGTVTDCTITGTVVVAGNYQVGGITGYGYSSITNCDITADAGSTITATYLEADLEGDAVGGIIGYLAEGKKTMQNCDVSGVTVSGTRKVGGVVGQAGDTITIDSCTFNGTVMCNANATYASAKKTFTAGILGETTGANCVVSNCTVTGTIDGVDTNYTNAIYGGTRTSGYEANTTTGNIYTAATVTTHTAS